MLARQYYAVFPANAQARAREWNVGVLSMIPRALLLLEGLALNARTFLLTLVIASTPPMAGIARGNNFEAKLKLISEFADKICNRVFEPQT
ncbi:MAG: hypothetical protein DLM68_02595, partial [Hyphomicrobiales bacterium]